VELSRVERTVRVNHDNDYGVGETEPTVRVRARDIYTLRHTHTRTAALTGGRLEGDSPSYYIEAVSRRRRGTGFGDLGIRKAHRFWSSRWAVLPMRRSRSSNSSSFDLARFVEGGRRPPPVFEIRRRWKDRTHWWWFDGDGNAVAVQDDDCEGGQHHRLVVSASLPCYTMDALVALWCCRLWEESAERAGRVHEGMEGGMCLSLPCQGEVSESRVADMWALIVRRKFRLAREVRPRFGPAFWP
jgi:hypothetical protein